ncbi:MAG: DNA-binding response regulator [Nitrospinae bacterium CG11_big_fil_rev_8_21_14_0_20_56_8]|nr:MAG: DNA-binding response regulator [Nitrospinae bacterium CG11_big_fil_rev_8_21_14_0_20_56_8]
MTTQILTDRKKINILIADDHPLFRRGLKHVFSETEDIHVAGEAETGQELLNLVRKNEFDLILMDIAMPGKSGLEILKQLKSEVPKIPVLILSVYPEEQYAVRFIKAGASGYLTKESASEKLLEAVRKVAGGGKFASVEITEKLAFGFFDTNKLPHEILSDREYQVFCMIAGGKSLTEIGEDLSLSVKTISTHRTRILEKMGMRKNAELIHYAIQHKLV